VAVQGSIQTRSYTDKDGNKRKAFEVVADNVHFAESKRDGKSQDGNVYPSAAFERIKQEAQQAGYQTDTGDFEEIPSDDDMPF
jgi:single-strand DNA-binding protein